MKLTITNNGTEPFAVRYTDMYKIYGDSPLNEIDPSACEEVVLEPDTSITLNNVSAIHQISTVTVNDPTFVEGWQDTESDLDSDFSLDTLSLAESDEEEDDDSDDEGPL